MSITGARRPLSEAVQDARSFRELFPPACYRRWEFAGSIRRKRPEVGDVEHVIEPNFGEVEVRGGLFAVRERVNLLWHHLDALVRGGEIKKHIYGTTGFRWGEKYRGVEYRGYLHELFTAGAENWGEILLIRTGPAEFSRRFVTVLRDGGMYRQEDGKCVLVSTGETVRVPDERTYLSLAGMTWIEPEKRG